MKAILAYFQGKFNYCSFNKKADNIFEVTLIDNVNQLEGSFTAEYDVNLVMVNCQADTGMKPIHRVILPTPPGG